MHDGEGRIHVLDLSHAATLEIRTDLGRNTIVVEDGSVRIAEADCPNGDCVRQGSISQPGQQLICLPHRLWVEVAQRDAASAQMDTAAVPNDEGDGADLVSR